jgi:hypothetical protein
MVEFIASAWGRLSLLAGAALGLAWPAHAAEAPPSVLAEVRADLNGDGIIDRAVLLRESDEDDVDLAVYLSADGHAATEPSLYRKAFGWAGDMAGTTPELSVNRAGSLVVVFQNDAIGRDRWRQQITIAFRRGELVVAGYDYSARDTLRPKFSRGCDLNFLSGEGVRDGKPVQLGAPAPRLADWTDKDKSVPETCRPD